MMKGHAAVKMMTVLRRATAYSIATSDSFNRADGTIAGSNTDAANGGVAKAWTQSSAGNWVIATNVLSEANVASLELATVILGSPRQKVQVTLSTAQPTTDARGSGVVARFTDTSNYYHAYFYRTNATTYGVFLDKVVAGTWTNVSSFSFGATPLADGDILSLECAAAVIIVRVNGVARISLTDNSISSGNGAGVIQVGGTSTTRFDNFLVQTA